MLPTTLSLQEAAIEEFFKPIDKEADMIMKMQLNSEESKMKEMMKAMQQQALLDRAEAEKISDVQNNDTKQLIQEKPSSESRHADGR